MNYLLIGGFNEKKLELFLSLTSIRSEDVKAAIYDRLVRGMSEELAAAANLVKQQNLSRALKTLNKVVETHYKINDIDRVAPKNQ